MQSPSAIDSVVSTCMARDASIWKTAAPRILDHIKSNNYVLIVPGIEIPEFKKISPAEIRIIDEECFLGGRDLGWVKRQLPSSLSARAGWYYQQLLKIDFLRSLEPGKIGVIWDADTIPLKDLKFTDDSGRLIYRLGTHRPRIHEPYFALIEALLGIKRSIDQSFISQCMPARAEWVRAFCEEIENRNPNADWATTVLNFVNQYPTGCGFSEYESLGSFFTENFATQMILQAGLYYRPANLFSPPDALDQFPFSRWAETMEYLAFDSYLTDKCTGLNIGCGNSQMLQAFDGGRCINIDKFATACSDLTMDLEKGLPFKDGQFTHIVAHNILEHVDDLYESIVEIDRLLAVGGVLSIEVPHIASYNHGTDVTHKRGCTFDSFNFLISPRSYLFPSGNSPFGYKLIAFNRENVVNGSLVRESLTHIPPRGTYREWVEAVMRFDIPGTFGLLLQKTQPTRKF